MPTRFRNSSCHQPKFGAGSLHGISSLIEVYPNSVSELSSIYFHTEKSGEAQVYPYDQMCQNTATRYNAEVQISQEHYVPLNRENLADDVYVCRLVVNGKVENRRITLIY